MHRDDVDLFYRTHVADPGVDHSKRKHFEIMYDFGIWKDTIGVMPMHECIVEIVDALGVEFVFLDELALLVDAVSGLDHRLLSWCAISWV